MDGFVFYSNCTLLQTRTWQYRWISFRLQNKEFVTLSRMRTNLYDNRRFTVWDGVLYLPANCIIFILQ